MSDHLTDADLIARLKASANGRAAGLSTAAVADAFGVKPRTFLASLEVARAPSVGRFPGGCCRR